MTALSIAQIALFAFAGTPAERVRLEYPKALIHLEQAYGHVQGSGLLSQHFVAAGKEDIHRSFRVEFALDGERCLARTLSLGDSGRELIYGQNPRPFQIRKGREGRPYTIVDLENSEATDFFVRRYAATYAHSPFAINAVPISTLMDDPGFKIGTVEPERIGDDDCLKIHYNLRSESWRIGAGWWAVAPNRGWILRQAHWANADAPANKTDMAIDYLQDSEGRQTPSVVQITVIDEGLNYNYQFKFDSIDFSKPPGEVFSLAHYGLPDLNAPAKAAPNRLPYWLGGLAIVSLITAGALRALSNRSRRT